MNYDKLLEPFPDSDIEWRIQQCGNKDGKMWGMVLAYVTNRAIQTRLDEVFGVPNWKNDFKTAPDGGVLCGISFYDNDKKEWITKWDGAENTNIEAVKGGLSGAMKRAAVQLGIGRWLYKLEPVFVTIFPKKPSDGNKYNYVNDKKQNVRGYWAAPLLNDPNIKEMNIVLQAASLIDNEIDLAKLWKKNKRFHNNNDFKSEFTKNKGRIQNAK